MNSDEESYTPSSLSSSEDKEKFQPNLPAKRVASKTSKSAASKASKRAALKALKSAPSKGSKRVGCSKNRLSEDDEGEDNSVKQLIVIDEVQG